MIVVQCTPIKNRVARKTEVLRYMKSASPMCAAPASVIDRETQKNTGIELVMYSDGKYCWSSETLYHFDKYDHTLNQDFINYVLSKS